MELPPPEPFPPAYPPEPPSIPGFSIPPGVGVVVTGISTSGSNGLFGPDGSVTVAMFLIVGHAIYFDVRYC